MLATCWVHTGRGASALRKWLSSSDIHSLQVSVQLSRRGKFMLPTSRKNIREAKVLKARGAGHGGTEVTPLPPRPPPPPPPQHQQKPGFPPRQWKRTHVFAIRRSSLEIFCKPWLTQCCNNIILQNHTRKTTTTHMDDPETRFTLDDLF